jgi:hypothetical protein
LSTVRRQQSKPIMPTLQSQLQRGSIKQKMSCQIPAPLFSR